MTHVRRPCACWEEAWNLGSHTGSGAQDMLTPGQSRAVGPVHRNPACCWAEPMSHSMVVTLCRTPGTGETEQTVGVQDLTNPRVKAESRGVSVPGSDVHRTHSRNADAHRHSPLRLVTEKHGMQQPLGTENKQQRILPPFSRVKNETTTKT